MSDGTTAAPTTWRSVAVARSVDPAREAAEERVQRFIDAAFELITGPSPNDLTVQNVVERSGLSLRSFYHHFAGKDELLLAVFEETIRASADHLSQEVDAIDDPFDRLRFFITEYYRSCRSGEPRNSTKRLPTRSIGLFAHQLLFDHPEDAARAFAPLVSLLRQVLDDAATAGVIRSDLDQDQLAGAILQAIMYNAFSTTVTGSVTDELTGRSDLLLELILHGVVDRR